MESLSTAIGLHKGGRVVEAERAYCAILAAEPNHAGALNLLGVIRQQQGRHEEALELIGRAIGINPNQTSFHNNYGAALLSLERFAEADASLLRALSLRPDYADALANLGMAQAALGNDAAAEASLRRALERQPWHRDATARLAKLLERQRRFDEAGKLLESALAASPCPQFRLALAHLRYAEGNAQAAAEAFLAALVPSCPAAFSMSRTPSPPAPLPAGEGSLRADGTRRGPATLANLPQPGPLPEEEGDRKRVAFVSPHCVLDFTNGAATATLDGLKILSRIGFQCEVFCGTRMDSWERARIEDVLRERGGRYEVQHARSPARPHPNPLPKHPHPGPLAETSTPSPPAPLPKGEGRFFNARMIFARHGDVPVTMVDTAPADGVGGPSNSEGLQHALTPGPSPGRRGEHVSLPGRRGEDGIKREGIAAFLTGCEMFFDRFRPDVVWTYGGDPAALFVQAVAKQRGIPVVFALHNFSYTDAAPFGMVDRVVVPTEFARRYYREKLGLECEVLPLVVDPERVSCGAGFQPAGNLADWKSALRSTPAADWQSAPRFVTFVNPEPRKGVHVFARIADVLARRRPDIPLLLVEGASKASFLPKLGIDRELVRNVRVMPNSPDARQFLAVTRLLLMPSLVENAAVVAMEAMFNGISVLASNRGGLPDTIGDASPMIDIPARYTPQTRGVPTAEEVEPWVETIIRLWDDADEYDRRSRAARERAQAWHPDRLAPVYHDFFCRIAALHR